jgi:hypothetical protein
MNVVELESFAVENTQPLRRSSRPAKASEEVIGRDKGEIMASNTFFQEKTFVYIKETINNNYGFTWESYNGNHDKDSKQLICL